MIQQFQEAKKMIGRAQNILLATHEDPDSDAVGSLLAMKIGLSKIGKKAVVFSATKAPPSLSFLPGVDQIISKVDLADVDLIIGLDYGHHQRLKLNSENLALRNFLTIDHHLVGEHLGFKIIKNNYSSTAEILYELFPYLNIAVDYKIATCLLTGIFSDTGGFRHANTSAQTLKIAGELLLKGAPLQKIAKAENSIYFPNNIKLWLTAFKNLEVDLETGIVFSLVAFDDLANAELEWKGSGIAGLLSSVPEIKFALLCAEKKPGQLECSLRSQKDRGINVAAIARIFGGGGHRLAAGFQSSDRPENIVSAIKKLALNNFASLKKEI
ncbi:DHH family phosphoesterase [Patescibacteria group bacterium]|nr:DHH family phosphoesterase [Patescibacteria group bacterium]